MAYVLGGVTLLKPKVFTRNLIETFTEHITIEGKTVKRIVNRKEEFVLEYQYLSQSQANAILALYELEEAVMFEVTETNIAIAETLVLVDIVDRHYPQSGSQFRQNIKIILTEVK